MRIPEPEDLDFTKVNPALTSRYENMIAGLQDSPDTYEDPRRADPEFEAITPTELTDGSFWARQNMSTPTSNPDRPRTRTAGYDSKNYILTVQFRDGTLYNYYDVNPEIWDEFRSATSINDFITSTFASWSNKGPVTGASSSSLAGYKGLGTIASKVQRKTFVGGTSKGTPFGGKL